MNRIAEFTKVSFQQFRKDYLDTFGGLAEKLSPDVVERFVKDAYDNIKLPERATIGSAGYDFRSPINFTLGVGDSIKIPTGVRCEMYDGWVLLGFPRSSYGFKYGVHHANDVPVIDGDYAYSDNEGHIFFKLVNDGALAKELKVCAGDAFCQGIFVPFGITLDDNVTAERNGGMGSTGR